jgi:Spy/CpxP family protein refolding chaperone
MADTLYLPDGSMEVIFLRDDFQRLIYEKLGSDAEQKLIEIIKEADYTQTKINTDLDAYEASLDSNTACFNDLLDSIEELKKLLQQQRIDRRKIYEVLDQMETQISNQI